MSEALWTPYQADGWLDAHTLSVEVEVALVSRAETYARARVTMGSAGVCVCGARGRYSPRLRHCSERPPPPSACHRHRVCCHAIAQYNGNVGAFSLVSVEFTLQSSGELSASHKASNHLWPWLTSTSADKSKDAASASDSTAPTFVRATFWVIGAFVALGTCFQLLSEVGELWQLQLGYLLDP